MWRLSATVARWTLLTSSLAGCACGEPPRTSIPELHVRRAASAPSIDGDLSEWDDAARTEVFVGTMDGSHLSLAPSARLMWDDDALYVAMELDDPLLRAPGQAQDDHLWEHDCVELMIDPDGDERRYLELQVSPRNVVFDTWFDTYRAPQPFGHVAWSSGLRSAVHARGTIDDDEADEGYSVEIAIPWSAFVAAGRQAVPPSEGETFRLQLYVLDERSDGQWAVGWSAPMVGDFHVPPRFGHVIFDR